MRELTSAEHITIARIIRVNHAGETGAIRIYDAQLWWSRSRHPNMVAALEKIRADEVRHCAILRKAMTEHFRADSADDLVIDLRRSAADGARFKARAELDSQDRAGITGDMLVSGYQDHTFDNRL